MSRIALPPGAVVHVVQHLSPGGLEVMALELARAQRGLGVPACVLSLEGQRDAAEAAWPRLAEAREHVHFAAKRPGIDASAAFRLASAFSAAVPACVHTHHVGPLLYAGAGARVAGVPVLLHTEHDAWHLSSPRRRALVSAAMSTLRPMACADAPHVARAFSEALRRPEPLVVPNGVDTARFRPSRDGRARGELRAALGLPPDAGIVGVCARLEHVKGVDDAIRAAALGSWWTLAIAGDGSQRASLEALAASLGVSDRVRFLGLLGDTVPFYRGLDALCLPSRDEGLPLTLLEAQACGIRVAAFRVGGVAAAVDPVSGWLVEKGDVSRMAFVLDRIVRDGTTRPNEGARSFVLSNGSLHKAAVAYLNLALGG